MIWDSACPPSCRAPHEGGCAQIPNLIVVEQARAQGVEIGFWQYFKVGAPLTLFTLLIGVWWL
jgi:Na+/H+ antiporter NhaD/arsenite permease-like protein